MIDICFFQNAREMLRLNKTLLKRCYAQYAGSKAVNAHCCYFQHDHLFNYLMHSVGNLECCCILLLPCKQFRCQMFTLEQKRDSGWSFIQLKRCHGQLMTYYWRPLGGGRQPENGIGLKIHKSTISKSAQIILQNDHLS